MKIIFTINEINFFKKAGMFLIMIIYGGFFAFMGLCLIVTIVYTAISIFK